jgi:hypothetical protein
VRGKLDDVLPHMSWGSWHSERGVAQTSSANFGGKRDIRGNIFAYCRYKRRGLQALLTIFGKTVKPSYKVARNSVTKESKQGGGHPMVWSQ